MRLLFPYLMSLFGILFLLNIALYNSARDGIEGSDSINRILQPPSDVIE